MTLEHLLSESLQLGATDIHIHSLKTNMVIQRRISGVLREAAHTVKTLNLINRIKVLSNLETSETKRFKKANSYFLMMGRKFPFE
jgi:Type II secretory pathway, ATPase PulE/Tfp pilus assembly pathway, ATPase PilB